MTQSTTKLWKTIERELLRAQDIETVVLKSHLLVETQINVALESGFGPEIERARLSFYQKLEVLACMCPRLKTTEFSIGPRSLYEAWKELNTLRNMIAHQLSPTHMRTLLVEWATKTLGYRLKTINRTVVLKRNIVKAIVINVAFFSGVIEEWGIRSNMALEGASRRTTHDDQGALGMTTRDASTLRTSLKQIDRATTIKPRTKRVRRKRKIGRDGRINRDSHLFMATGATPESRQRLHRAQGRRKRR